MKYHFRAHNSLTSTMLLSSTIMVSSPWLSTTGLSISILFWLGPCGATYVALVVLTSASGLLCHCNQRASRPGCLSLDIATGSLSCFLCIQSTLSCCNDSLSLGMLLFFIFNCNSSYCCFRFKRRLFFFWMILASASVFSLSFSTSLLRSLLRFYSQMLWNSALL